MCFLSFVAFLFVSASFPPPEAGRAEDGQAVSEEETEGERGWGLRENGPVVFFGCLSVGAVLVGGVGVDGGAVWLLAVFARRHPLIYPVQAARLLEVTDLPRGREALNGWKAEQTPERK